MRVIIIHPLNILMQSNWSDQPWYVKLVCVCNGKKVRKVHFFEPIWPQWNRALHYFDNLTFKLRRNVLAVVCSWKFQIHLHTGIIVVICVLKLLMCNFFIIIVWRSDVAGPQSVRNVIDNSYCYAFCYMYVNVCELCRNHASWT